MSIISMGSMVPSIVCQNSSPFYRAVYITCSTCRTNITVAILKGGEEMEEKKCCNCGTKENLEVVVIPCVEDDGNNFTVSFVMCGDCKISEI